MAKQTFTLYTEDANLGGYDSSKFYRAEYSFIHWDDEEHPDFIVTLRFLEKDVDNELSGKKGMGTWLSLISITC